MNRDKMIQIIFMTSLIALGFATQAFCNNGCLNIPGTVGTDGNSATVASLDPNSLTGPGGYGDSHYVPAKTLLAYRIDFENDASASAPAQQVTITNQLEASLDWQTFQITEIGFGDHFIAVPPGSQNYQTVIPMTFDGVSFEVHVEVGIDLSTGIVSTDFYSIDPTTGWPPPVNIGFLPPEDGSERGMGHVSYTINHKVDLAEGTEIRNVALIVFDQGEQIYTNQVDPHDPSQGTDPQKEALVTIDSERPVSRVTFLPETSDSTFTVSWTGSDSASEIAGYDIYTRDGQEVTWRLWQERTSESSAEFTGLPSHSYEFYSVAIDNVGYREQKDPVPDSKTSVNTIADQDGDGIADATDNCPQVANADQSDLDTDGIGGLCDTCPKDADNDIDGDGVCGDVDNCPSISNAGQADLDQDGIGDLCDPQTCGNAIIETIEKCDDGNRLNGDGCSSQCITETTITVSKAKVNWHEGKIKYRGSIRLPLGLIPYDISPQSSVNIDVPSVGQVVSNQVFFAIKGREGKKWVFNNGTGGVQAFKIDWKGARFNYKGLLHIKTHYIGSESTSLEIKRKGLTGAFFIRIGEISIQVDAGNNVIASPATILMEKDDYDHEIEVDLPFALTSDMTMVISRPDFPDTQVSVADYLSYSTGKFDLRARFDPAGLSGLDDPAILNLRITLGKVGYPGYAQISSGWKIIKDKKWKHED